jgi:hypothetical protein
MNIEELEILKNKIKILNALNYLFLLVNILLIIMPFIHYWSVGFEFDTYFLIITILNIIGFYISYVIANKLVFLKNKHRHFTDKLTTKQQ